MDVAQTVEMQIEFSQGWIDENPQLFTESLSQWHQITTQKGLTVRSVDRRRSGLVVYTAKQGS